jgi:catalase
MGARGRKVAILVADGVAAAGVEAVREAVTAEGAIVELLAPVDGAVTTSTGKKLTVDRAMNTVGSVLYDAVVVADGEGATAELVSDGYAVHFVAEAYKHAKPLGLMGSGQVVAEAARLPAFEASDRLGKAASKPPAGAADGVVVHAPGAKPGKQFTSDLVTAIAGHRFYDRPVDGIAA